MARQGSLLRKSFPKMSVSLPPLSILLVEDNQEDAYLIRKILNQIGRVYWFEGVEPALKSCKEQKYDFVLTSLRLKEQPSMDNFVQLRSRSGNLPIIVLKDNDTALLAESAIQDGAMAVLDKNMIDQSDYLIKMMTAFLIEARFIKKAEELKAEEDKKRKYMVRTTRQDNEEIVS